MRNLLIIIAILTLPAITFAARFDFTNGQPAVVNDGTPSDSFEQTRYDFTNGEPAGVYDATATDQSSVSNSTLIMTNGTRIMTNGSHIMR